MIKRNQVVQWLRAAATILEENRDFLTKLDAALGDADHGINMDRGFKRVMDILSKDTDRDIGSILTDTGMALISSVGGASGPLYGTFFLRAGTAASGKRELRTTDVADLFAAGLEGLTQRGRAKTGDKTMVDALAPAVEVLKGAAAEKKDIQEALRLVVSAAEEGMRETIPMLAKKGRASYLGERSIGHQDPGATSSYLILKALHDTVSE